MGLIWTRWRKSADRGTPFTDTIWSLRDKGKAGSECGF